MAPKHCTKAYGYLHPQVNVAKGSTDGNHCLKRIVAWRHNLLCGMGIKRFGHVVFGGYAFVELVQKYHAAKYSGQFPCIESKTVVAMLKSIICWTLSSERSLKETLRSAGLESEPNDSYGTIFQVLKFVDEYGATVALNNIAVP